MTKFKWEQPYKPENPNQYDPAADPRLERSVTPTDQTRMRKHLREDAEIQHRARISGHQSEIHRLEQAIHDFTAQIDKRRTNASSGECVPATWQLEAARYNAEDDLVSARQNLIWAQMAYARWLDEREESRR